MKAPVTLTVWPSDGDGSRIMDRSEATRALRLLVAPGERHELRSLPGGRSKPAPGDDHEAAAAAAFSLDGTVYYSLNPIAVTAERAKKSTVVRRANILIDVDPVRGPELSSTEAEKAAAAEVVTAINDHLLSLGWPAPLIIDSGNGWHLVYRVDLPNDKLAHQLVKQLIYALADRFDTEAVKVDRAVHDPARISKLPGTWARKGVDTAERPHRIARIAYEPERMDAVPVELLKRAAEPEQPAEPEAAFAPSKPLAPVTTGGASLANYLAKAIEAECVAVALAPVGGRNDRLNTAAFNLGMMADWPEMNAASTQERLARAGVQAGLNEVEIRLTVKSGWDAGAETPRKRPDPGKGKEKNPAAAIPAGQPLTISADEVTPEVVTWLWEDRIAVGFISLFAGRTGVGKSFVLCDIAARLSAGREFPDGSPPRPVGGTLFISEDPYQYVLVPRLIELKADRKKIGFMRWEAMAGYSLADTDFLNAAWEERGRPSLIVVDPPANFLGGKDEHKNSEVRAVLMKIVAWLESRAVAMVLITHYNKGGAQKALDALDRIMGSVAWSSSSRVACGFMIDPNDQSKCIFGGIKNNLGQKAEPLSYQIKKTETLAVVEWLGKSDTSLDDALNQKAPRKVCAVEFLTRQFRTQACWSSNELFHLAKVEGVSRDAIFEAKRALPIRSTLVYPQDGSAKFWEWQAHPGWPSEPLVKNESPQLPQLRQLEPNPNGGNTHLSVAMEHDDATVADLSNRRKSRKNRRVASRKTDASLRKRAVQLVASLVGGGPVERNLAVVAAAEDGIPLDALNEAAEVFGVEVSLRDGKEYWSAT
jgi:hypothetical protein